jgi:hypothetical protein
VVVAAFARWHAEGRVVFRSGSQPGAEPADHDGCDFGEFRGCHVLRSGDEDYLGVWPALGDEGVGLCDVHVIGAVDDQHRCAGVLAEQAAADEWPVGPAVPAGNWKQARNRWEFFQGLRSWLLLAGFVLTRAGFAIG